ncbi:MAG TPA: glutamate--tRNA ligase family protein [Gemmatimonadales bacterium]|nr:glutamate--tRNA ligase family protein [Gemmatimonadales bacterium]
MKTPDPLARPLTRFAPSPTGYLHLGHVANAVHVWGVAQARNGRVLLRVEDHDRGRCRPEYEAAILEDLDWLGLEPDIGLPDEFRRGNSQFRQSDNHLRYASALQALGSRFRVYACDCSRKDIAPESDVPDQETRYPGRCRLRNLAVEEGRGIRVAIDPGTETFNDMLLGEQEQDPSAQCGDLLLRDRLGNWTYQFAVTVDDLEQHVDLVIRGQDLLASTGRQIRLARMLGRNPPAAYMHHPLIRHGSGAKLSKSNRDTGIRDLRAAGKSASWVLGQAAYLTGLIDRPRELRAHDLGSFFVS